MDVVSLETGNAALIKFIRERIAARGPVTFAWLMEQALYHPEHGYYSSGRATIGREGDYFTNVSVGPVFGQLMAAQFAEMWSLLDQPAEFTIVEQGAHDGQFAHDVLAAAQGRHLDFFAAVRYKIVEPFPLVRARQLEMLAGFAERVTWSESLELLDSFCGVHFSNELLDAMPVHLVRWTGSEWLERLVRTSGGDFSFEDAPVVDEALRAQLARVPSPRNAGYTTEVSPARLSFIAGLACKLTKGFVLAVDYGFLRDDFYAPHRSSGTLQCYRKHQVISSPLTHVGDADLTAHVEWSSVAERAQAAGLRLIGFTDQHHFIAGLLTGTDGAGLIQEQTAKAQRALQTLLHPGFLGMKFQFLVLAKGVDQAVDLTGLRFARNPHNALGVSS